MAHHGSVCSYRRLFLVPKGKQGAVTKIMTLAISAVLSALVFFVAPDTCEAQLSTYVNSANLGCAASCPDKYTIQNPVFQNLFVFVPGSQGETWDQHLAAFITAHPLFSPPNCIDGTEFPCLQGLTSESINQIVQTLVNSNYFQAMENSYSVGAPVFAGEQSLVPICTPGPGAASASSISYLDLLNLVNCQVNNTPNSPLQLNLIFAPDLPPPANLGQPPVCVGGSNDFAFHSFAPSGVNIQQYLTNPPFLSGFQQCVAGYLSPISGLFGTDQQCLARGVTQQCWNAALAGAVTCPVFDIFAPGVCEVVVSSYVGTCVAAALTQLPLDAALAGEISFTAIPTNNACFAHQFLNYPRQIVGGGGPSSQASTQGPLGGLSGSLDLIAVAISHEMVETITDPALGLGWVHPGSLGTDQFNTGEIGDICEPGSPDNPVPLSYLLPTYMPFLFLHVSRYWSNADEQCMPQFDAVGPLMAGPPGTNGFTYSYAPVASRGSGDSIDVGVAGAAAVPNGFWGNALSSSPTNQPNIRVTDVTASPPQQFGNSIDLGGSDKTLSYSMSNAEGLPIQINANANADDHLVLEVWDGRTGQGCRNLVALCANWPPPSSCALEVQPPVFTPVSCTATLLAETLAYGLPQPPLGGNVIYTLSSGSISQTPDPCDAISPCPLTVTIHAGSGTYQLTASDTVSPPAVVPFVGSNWPSPASVTLSCSLNVTFNFPTTGANQCAGGSFTLTVGVVGAGTVTGTGSSGNQIDCTNTGTGTSESGTCSALYANGNNAGLTAAAMSGWKFSAWNNCSNPNNGGTGTLPSCSAIVTGNLSVGVTFVPVGTP